VALDHVLSINAGGALTFFEITTAMAFHVFARHEADFVLLETGMGGRLDCTNVIENPAITIITKIGYDHMEFLGNTLEKIAGEKAGIMKRDCPCILAPQSAPEIESVFEKTAAALPCPLYKAQTSGTKTSNLQGPYQQENIATALCAISHIHDINIDEQAIEAGLKAIHWPGRLQKLTSAALPHNCEIWLDGGHNESAGQALAKQLAQWKNNDPKELHLILGMMPHKNPQRFIEPLWAHIDRITIMPIKKEQTEEDCKNLAHKIACGRNMNIDIRHELADILSRDKENVRYLITGSLYLAGQVLEELQADK
jgi:dihydrofolate synthase/folylpolyglutamate synthase